MSSARPNPGPVPRVRTSNLFRDVGMKGPEAPSKRQKTCAENPVARPGSPEFPHHDVLFFKSNKDRDLGPRSLNYLSNFHGGHPGDRKGNLPSWPVPGPCNIPVIWRPHADYTYMAVGAPEDVVADEPVSFYAKTSEQVFMLCKLAHWERAIRARAENKDFTMNGIRRILLKPDLEPQKARTAMGRKATTNELERWFCPDDARNFNGHALETWGRPVDTNDSRTAPRVQAMLKVLRLKFIFGKKILKEVLQSTGEQRLGESSGRAGDHFWECTRKLDFEDKSHNWLGRLLMQVRDEIKCGGTPQAPL